MRRYPLAMLCLVIALALVVAACDDDNDDDATTSAEEAFCADAESLEASIDNLVNLDVVAEGTNGVETALDAVKEDFDSLKESGQEVASDELDALDTALNDLDESLQAAGDDLSAENATAVVGDVSSAATAAQGVRDTFRAACE
jgi:hypothetical protein